MQQFRHARRSRRMAKLKIRHSVTAIGKAAQTCSWGRRAFAHTQVLPLWVNEKNKKNSTRPLTVLITGAIVQLEQRKRNKRNEENRSKVPEGVPNPELF